jgi:hypothetical protein
MPQEDEESPELAELLALLQGALGGQEPGLAGLFGSGPEPMPGEASPHELVGDGLPPLIRMLLALDQGADRRAMRPDVGDLADANTDTGGNPLAGLFGARKRGR